MNNQDSVGAQDLRPNRSGVPKGVPVRGPSSDPARRIFAIEIINAAWALVEDGEIRDFTVRQVVDRAGVALQTFYRYFGNKDELLLAMFEQSMREGADRVLAFPVEDPVERLRYIVTRPIVRDFDERTERVTRWRGRERQRLIEFFPDAVEAVYEPYRAAIASTIVAVCDAGRGFCDEPDVDAKLILHLVQEMTHGVRGGGIDDPPELVAERLWHMVSAGMAIDAPPSLGAPRARA
jgi:TetR/AcrR family transcriptional regulator